MGLSNKLVKQAPTVRSRITRVSFRRTKSEKPQFTERK